MDVQQLEMLREDVSRVSVEVSNFADEIKRGQRALAERILDLEQRSSRQGTAGAGYVPTASGIVGGGRSAGQIVANSPEFERLRSSPGRRGRAIVEVGSSLAAITTITAGASRDTLVAPDRQPGIVPLPQCRLTIRALLQPVPTSSNAIQYTREVAFTNAAAPVSEGALKPESNVEFELINAPVATIAHIMVASKQILDDASVLQSHIDGRLRYGVALAEENQLLYGDGSGVNLFGMVPQATPFSAPFSISAPTRLDVLAQAISQVEQSLFPVTGLILNSLDWRELMLIKDSQGRYIGAGPFGSASTYDNLWGIPVAHTPALVAGTFVAGALGLAVNLYDRETTTVEVSTEDSDNFRKNLVTLRGEERIALTVSRPDALVRGSY